jgi:hypothetical protein
MFERLFLVLMLCTMSSIALAQTDAESAPDLDPKTASSAGFAVQYDGFFDPLVTETSNSVIYGFSLQRNSFTSGIYNPDVSMPLMRLSQTIAPLSAIGTSAQMLEAAITDATISVRQMLNNPEFALPTSTDCTRSIGSTERAGKRFAITVDAEGTEGFLECYAFEDSSGKGIGVILKYRAGADAATSIDENILLDDILTDLTIKPLENYSPYTMMLAGYPITLPVLSRVDGTKQLTEYAVESAITLENASLTLQLMRIPDGYRVGEYGNTAH